MTSNLSRIIPLITMIGAIGLLALNGVNYTAYWDNGQVSSSFSFELPSEISSQLGFVLLGGATLGAGLKATSHVLSRKGDGSSDASQKANSKTSFGDTPDSASL